MNVPVCRWSQAFFKWTGRALFPALLLVLALDWTVAGAVVAVAAGVVVAVAAAVAAVAAHYNFSFLHCAPRSDPWFV